MPIEAKKTILITIDVEDWFQVENFKTWIPFSTWPSRELRVEKNTNRLLDLFDSIDTKDQSDSTETPKIKATFFILGWIAEKVPHLVKEIHNRGHEVASHGYNHNLCPQEPPHKFSNDLKDSKKLLEDIIGDNVAGYRAPSFSINSEVLKIIEDSGYTYDSSFNSFGMNPRYGKVNFKGYRQQGIAFRMSDTFYELPISNVVINNTILPFGGGGYFRLLPFALFRLGIQNILNRDRAYMFYMHPWEIDPEQPRVAQASPLFKFRHYVNLSIADKKLSALIRRFKHCNFITCRDYLNLQRTVA